MLNLLSSPITREDIASLATREGLDLEDERRIGVLLSDGSIDVQACPGSGKTTLVAAKLMLLATKWRAPDRGVCVLSHTNVAKNEIIDRLNAAKTIAARRLLKYPHFIGTIQDFTDRFLAMPYLRSRGIPEITVDNDEYLRVMKSLLARGQFKWFSGTLNGLADRQDSFLLATHRTHMRDEETDVNFSMVANGWKKNFARAQADLRLLKSYLEDRGVFLFRDMYVYAQIAAHGNESLPKILSKRFACVFLDEMQDTQRSQDELLRRIFPLRDGTAIVQRFGDPDQAIFNMDEDPNESFNGKSAEDMDFVIHRSHRFDDEIARLIRGMSHNEVPLESELDEALLRERATLCAGPSFQHTVFAFDDDNRREVVGQFAEAIARQFNVAYRRMPCFRAKAVGAVGNKVEPNVDHLKLGHYWESYDKEKTATTYSPGQMIEAVHHCRRRASRDWAPNYKTLMDCLIRLLRLAGARDVNGRRFSATSLRARLEPAEAWQKLRRILYTMLDDHYVIAEGAWTDLVAQLAAVLQLDGLPDNAAQYLQFAPDEAAAAEVVEEVGAALRAMPRNVAKYRDEFVVELSTIHGVKGETHDATLVVETKNYIFDMEVMLPYLTGEAPSDALPNSGLAAGARNKRANVQFMRQLYVAMSRPKHLLCLAVHTDRLSADQARLLEGRGWVVRRLVGARDAAPAGR